MNISVTGWNNLIDAEPLDPRAIIANVSLGASTTTFKRSTSFLQSSWGTNTVGFTGNANLQTLNPTEASTIAYASQWTLATKMVNTGASINGAVGKLVFAKAGTMWQNNIELAFGATNWTDVQLSLRDNLGTSGSFLNSATGAVPVFSFSGTLTGNQSLGITFLQPGVYSLVLVVSNAGTYSTFEMEVVVMA